MARRPSKYAAVPPVRQKPMEFKLGRFAFADDTPMATVIQALSEPVKQAVLEILLEHHGFPGPNPLECPIAVSRLFIGRPDFTQHGRSLLTVGYELTRVPPRRPNQKPVSPRSLSKPRLFLAQIGAGSQDGIAIFWDPQRSFT